VSVLKPLHGSEPGLFPRLAVLCDQDYAQEIQIVCGTQAAADPALHVVGLLKRRYPKTQIDVVVDERSHGTNRKISNLRPCNLLLMANRMPALFRTREIGRQPSPQSRGSTADLFALPLVPATLMELAEGCSHSE
jgi:hypothetical protein